ncbi:hypothetical protein OPS25_05380 [Alteromonas ponticola]|uniref:Transporter substrate-binding domain-containing protein n=1 Tax=Alteromonas aquimaris TaxID=2998417 RepID=A0ABT3P581_9ALTE|nr:transporter substrate-binding domain-containing protein [Alteromonas aquimaris]MCW8107924.1 hypothetical protein [Alteromonas aquimaris]
MFVRKKLIFILISHLVLVGTVKAEIKPIYRIGVEDVSYYPLQNFQARENKGVLASILNLFARTEGINIEFIPLPIHRFTAWFDEGNIDLRIPDHPVWSQSLQPELIYSAPVLLLCESTVVLAKNIDKSQSAIKSIGILHGFTPSRRWRKSIEKGEVELISDASLKVLTRMLMNEMVDGLNVEYSAIQYQVKELGYDQSNVKISRRIPQTQFSYHMSTIRHQDILKKFNDFLDRYRQEIIAIKRSHDFLSNRTCLPSD